MSASENWADAHLQILSDLELQKRKEQIDAELKRRADHRAEQMFQLISHLSKDELAKLTEKITGVLGEPPTTSTAASPLTTSPDSGFIHTSENLAPQAGETLQAEAEILQAIDMPQETAEASVSEDFSIPEMLIPLSDLEHQISADPAEDPRLGFPFFEEMSQLADPSNQAVTEAGEATPMAAVAQTEQAIAAVPTELRSVDVPEFLKRNAG